MKQLAQEPLVREQALVEFVTVHIGLHDRVILLQAIDDAL